MKFVHIVIHQDAVLGVFEDLGAAEEALDKERQGWLGTFGSAVPFPYTIVTRELVPFSQAAIEQKAMDYYLKQCGWNPILSWNDLPAWRRNYFRDKVIQSESLNKGESV